jgi:hypothetical protein
MNGLCVLRTSLRNLSLLFKPLGRDRELKQIINLENILDMIYHIKRKLKMGEAVVKQREAHLIGILQAHSLRHLQP